MSAEEALNLADIGAGLFPDSILSADFIPALARVQGIMQDWTAFQGGVELADAPQLVADVPITIRLNGNYGGTYDYPRPAEGGATSFTLYGSNPLLGWTGSVFISPQMIISGDLFPAGTVLPFTGALPPGWSDLASQLTGARDRAVFLEIGTPNLAVQDDVLHGHSHNLIVGAAGGLFQPAPEDGSAQAMFMTGNNSNFRGSETGLISLGLFFHQHSAILDPAGSDEGQPGYPDHKRVQYGIKL